MRRTLLFSLTTLAVAVLCRGLPSAPRITGFCSGTGYKCDVTCKYLGSCQRGQSGYVWSLVQSCGESYCNASATGCSPDATACEETEPKLQCVKAGMYPNPYDCTRAFKCDPEVGTVPLLCPVGKRYNPCTKDCDLPLVNGQCTDLEPACTRQGEVKVIAGNPRIYYECARGDSGRLIPVMNQCEGGFYDVNIGMCVTSSEPGCQYVSTQVQQCTSPGLKPDPNDCRAYFFCNRSLQPLHIQCSPGYRFGVNGCVPGRC